jgi:hypothetical protein
MEDSGNQRKQSCSAHDQLASDRLRGEQEILRRIDQRRGGGLILLLGSSPARHRERADIWYLCPLICNKDYLRKDLYAAHKEKQYCHCSLVSWKDGCCVHARSAYERLGNSVKALVLSFSLSSVKPEDIAYFYNSFGTVFSLNYIFYSAYGDLKGQGRFKRDAYGTVNVYLNDGSMYQNNYDWVMQTSYKLPTGSLTWQSDFTVWDNPVSPLEVLRFVTTPLDEIIRLKAPSEHALSLYEPLDLRTKKNRDHCTLPMFHGFREWVEGDNLLKACYPLRDQILFQFEDGPLEVIPMASVLEVSAKVSGAPRDKSSFKACIGFARTALANESIPTPYAQRLVQSVAAAGFLEAVHREAKAIAIVTRHSPDVDIVNNYLIEGTKPELHCSFYKLADWFVNSWFGLLLYSLMRALKGYEALVFCFLLGVLVSKSLAFDPETAASENVHLVDWFLYLWYMLPCTLWLYDECFKYRKHDNAPDSLAIRIPPYDGDRDCNLLPVLCLCGPHYGTKFPRVLHSCIHNELNGLTSRHIVPKFRPRTGVWDAISKTFHILPQFTRLRSIPVQWFSLDEWIAHFKSSRRRILETQGLGDLYTYARDPYKAFCKVEHILKEDPEGWAPRLIQSTTIGYQKLTGPPIYSISKHFAKYFRPNFSEPINLVYAAGMTARQLSNWYEMCLEVGLNVAVELDVSRWDTGVSVEALLFEFGVYRLLGLTDLKTALDNQITKVIYTKGGLKVVVTGTRATGCNNTSVGNFLNNAACAVHVTTLIFRSNNLLPKDRRCSILIQGDDILIMTTDEAAVFYAALSKPVYNSAGFDLSKFHIREQPEFCNNLFWPNSEGYQFGPKPGRVLAKSFIPLRPQARKELSVLKGIAECFLASAHFVPVLSQICIRLIQILHRLEAVTYFEEWKPRPDCSRPADDCTLNFFLCRYQVSYADYRDTLSWIDTWTQPRVCYDAAPLNVSLFFEALRAVDVPEW